MLNLFLYLLGFWAFSNAKQAPILPRAEVVVDRREYNVEKYLFKNSSPLADYSSDFIRASEKYGFDYKVLVAISGVESRFGTDSLCGDYNPFGYGNPCWDFSSYSEAIWQVAKTIGTSKASGYRGFRETNKIYQLATAYNSPHAEEWAGKVKFFINQLNENNHNSGDIP